MFVLVVLINTSVMARWRKKICGKSARPQKMTLFFGSLFLCSFRTGRKKSRKNATGKETMMRKSYNGCAGHTRRTLFRTASRSWAKVRSVGYRKLSFAFTLCVMGIKRWISTLVTYVFPCNVFPSGRCFIWYKYSLDGLYLLS